MYNATMQFVLKCNHNVATGHVNVYINARAPNSLQQKTSFLKKQ
jgi:hypothetical protein